jgi:hypothetical protein
MSRDDRDHQAAAAEEDLGRAGDEQASSLPRTLQEHLAQKLRSAYHELSDKPAFLGDPTLPVEFEYHLARLEAVERERLIERVRTQGLEAVKAALEDIAARSAAPHIAAGGKRGGS